MMQAVLILGLVTSAAAAEAPEDDTPVPTLDPSTTLYHPAAGCGYYRNNEDVTLPTVDCWEVTLTVNLLDVKEGDHLYINGVEVEDVPDSIKGQTTDGRPTIKQHGHVTVRFTSDNSGVGLGFALSYECTPEPMVVTWCTSDAACRTLGDSESVCEEGKCSCSAGFSNPVVEGVTAYTCVAEGGSGAYFAETSTLRVDGVFEDGDCSAFLSGEGMQAAFKTILREELGAGGLELIITCGSVHFSAMVTVGNEKLAGLDAAMAAVGERVRGSEALRGSLGEKMEVTAATEGSGGLVACEVVGATASSKLAGVCHAVSCGAGYQHVEIGGVWGCQRNIGGDDDLKDRPGVIVALVLSVVAILASLVVVFKHVTKKQKSAGGAPPQAVENHEPAEC